MRKEGYNMKEKFKAYLEQHFKRIAPTQAAMEFRKDTLRRLLDREQELRIKGIDDDDLIYKMAIDELGDFDKTLDEFQHQQIKSGALKRRVSAISVISVCSMVILALVYLLVGLFAHVWHPTWLIMVGGVFVGVSIMLAYVGIAKCVKNKKFIIVRISVAIIEVLFSVFLFLVLQLVANINGAWLTFLAMIILIFGVDTALSFLTNSKEKWIELPIFVEIFCVMLYVILGIAIGTIWHPGWILCLGGVAFAMVEAIYAIAKRTHKKDSEEKEKIRKKHVKVDESYWTEWDD